MSPASALRVLCYNIRHGQGVGGILSNARIARVVSSSGCDLAAMTEVWRRSSVFDQPETLSRMTGMDSHFAPLFRTAGVESGNLLLSRLRIRDTYHVDLGGKRERRGCLVADVEFEGGDFAFAVTHLSLHQATRAIQLKLLADELPRDRPLIIAGDFNCTVSELGPLSDVVHFPADVPPTYPSPFPFRSLDHVGFSSHWAMESLGTLNSWASDHRPLVATLELCGASAGG